MTENRPSFLLIRLLVGWVFVVEGILKFVRPDELGVGRFAKIGIPFPQYAAPFVGVAEIVCGGLILLGFLTGIAAVVLLLDMTVAILATKLPILLGHGYWRFTVGKFSQYGLLTMLHEARTDFSMVLALLFLLVSGAGGVSLDRTLSRRRE